MAWNVFKFCTALRALGSIMIVFVLGIICLTYYAVVLADFGPALFHGGLDSLTAFAVLLLFHFLLVMLLWSYFAVVLTDPGGVPPNWKPATDEERGDTDPLVGSEYNREGLNLNQLTMLGDPANERIRFCRKCNQYKPPRCHHCSVCGRCILKMDHHCVWVVNCVGALNYKYFLLFLVVINDIYLEKNYEAHLYWIAWCLFNFFKFYTFLETALVTLSLLPYFIAFFTGGELPGTPGTLAATFITFVLNLAFSLSVMGFMIMHLSLVAANTTTIEAYEKKTTPKWQYDLGRKKNFQQAFGLDKRYWFIPAYSDDDLRRIPALQGLEYPTKAELNALQQF